jgi:hypothetical protein
MERDHDAEFNPTRKRQCTSSPKLDEASQIQTKTIPCASFREPYCSLLLNGAKTIETRKWPVFADHEGLLAVHCAYHEWDGADEVRRFAVEVGAIPAFVRARSLQPLNLPLNRRGCHTRAHAPTRRLLLTTVLQYSPPCAPALMRAPAAGAGLRAGGGGPAQPAARAGPRHARRRRRPPAHRPDVGVPRRAARPRGSTPRRTASGAAPPPRSSTPAAGPAARRRQQRRRRR